MRRVTNVDMNIDIGQGLHVGSVVKEKGLVLDREVEIEGDKEELAPKFLNFIFLLYFFIIIIFLFYYFFLFLLCSNVQFIFKIGSRLRAARYLTFTSCSLG